MTPEKETRGYEVKIESYDALRVANKVADRPGVDWDGTMVQGGTATMSIRGEQEAVDAAVAEVSGTSGVKSIKVERKW